MGVEVLSLRPKVFVAFPGPDRERARELVNYLGALGVEPRWEGDIAASAPYAASFSSELETADAFVFVVTAATEKAYYQGAEAVRAVQRHRDQGIPLLVATDLPSADLHYDLLPMPPIRWQGRPEMAAVAVVADLLGWKKGARNAEIPDTEPAGRRARWEAAAALALAIAIADPGWKSLGWIAAFLRGQPLMGVLPDALLWAPPPVDPLFLLRGALFRMADANVQGALPPAMLQFAEETAKFLRKQGLDASRVEGWIQKQGTVTTGLGRAPALLVRMEPAEGGKWVLVDGEVRRGDTRMSAVVPEKYLGRPLGLGVLGATLAEVVRQLQPQGVDRSELLVMVDVDETALTAGFEGWPGTGKGTTLKGQVRAVTLWPRIPNALDEIEPAVAPGKATPDVVPAPVAGKGPCVRVDDVAAADRINSDFEARIAVFASKNALCAADGCCPPVRAHDDRHLTILLEVEDLGPVLTDLFQGLPEVPLTELLQRLKNWPAHLIWTDFRYAPSWHQDLYASP